MQATAVTAGEAESSQMGIVIAGGVGAVFLLLCLLCRPKHRQLCYLMCTHPNPSMGPLYMPSDMRNEYATQLGEALGGEGVREHGVDGGMERVVGGGVDGGVGGRMDGRVDGRARVEPYMEAWMRRGRWRG